MVNNRFIPKSTPLFFDRQTYGDSIFHVENGVRVPDISNEGPVGGKAFSEAMHEFAQKQSTSAPMVIRTVGDNYSFASIQAKQAFFTLASKKEAAQRNRHVKVNAEVNFNF